MKTGMTLRSCQVQQKAEEGQRASRESCLFIHLNKNPIALNNAALGSLKTRISCVHSSEELTHVHMTSVNVNVETSH